MLLPFVLLGLRLGGSHRRGCIWGRRKRIGRRDSTDVDRIPGRRCDGGGDSDGRPVAETRRRRAGCNRGPAGAAPDVVGCRWEPARDCSPLSLFPESKMSQTLVKLQSLLMQNNFGVAVRNAADNHQKMLYATKSASSFFPYQPNYKQPLHPCYVFGSSFTPAGSKNS